MDAYIISISRQALYLTLIITAIPVGAALLVGLMVSLLQATTQVQEQTLTFVPKLVIVFVILSVLGPWSFFQLITYTNTLFTQIPTYVK